MPWIVSYILFIPLIPLLPRTSIIYTLILIELLHNDSPFLSKGKVETIVGGSSTR